MKCHNIVYMWLGKKILKNHFCFNSTILIDPYTTQFTKNNVWSQFNNFPNFYCHLFYCILSDFTFKYLVIENPKSSFAMLLDNLDWTPQKKNPLEIMLSPRRIQEHNHMQANTPIAFLKFYCPPALVSLWAVNEFKCIYKIHPVETIGLLGMCSWSRLKQ